MGQPNDNHPSSSNNKNEEKQLVSSSQDDESNKERLLTFQKYYVADYVADQEGRLEKNKENIVISKPIHIKFNFQKPSLIPDIHVSQTLRLYNFLQFKLILSHYYYQSNVLNPIINHSKYKDLQREIKKRKISQFNIDKKINELSKYLTFTFKIDRGDFYIIYTKLNRSTLPLVINHLQSILLVLKTWSYLISDSNKIDGLMKEISRQCKDRLTYKPFQTYYIDSLMYTYPKLPVMMLKTKFSFTKHTLKTTLNIRNIDQFTAVLRFYDHNTLQDFTPFNPSSKYKYLCMDITYHNNLQVCMDKILKVLNRGDCLKIKKDEYDPLKLNLHYSYNETYRPLTFVIRHLEFLTLTFKTGNDDENDKDAMDLYLSEVKDKFLPFLKDKSFESLGVYYRLYLSDILSISNNLQFNLHIILRQYQHTITKTLYLEESERFVNLLDYHNYLPNGYLFFSKSFDKSLYNLLYILDGDENNPSILNLYYYPFSNELDTFLIIKHLTLMVCSFKDFKNNKPNDIFEVYQCLSSIAVELNSLSNPRLSLPRLHLPKTSPFDPSLFNPSLTNNKNTQLSISTPINLSFPSTISLSSKPSKPFGHPHNPTDPNTVLFSSLTLHLKLLPFDNLYLKDTLHFKDTSRFISILDHYSLIPNTFDPSNTIDPSKLSNQNTIDNLLLKLPDHIIFYSEWDKDDSTANLTYSNLKPKDTHSTLLHLELMVRVFKTGSHDRHGTKVLNDFVKKARSTIMPRIPYNDEDEGNIITTLSTNDRDHIGTSASMEANENISMMGDVD